MRSKILRFLTALRYSLYNCFLPFLEFLLRGVLVRAFSRNANGWNISEARCSLHFQANSVWSTQFVSGAFSMPSPTLFVSRLTAAMLTMSSQDELASTPLLMNHPCVTLHISVQSPSLLSMGWKLVAIFGERLLKETLKVTLPLR